MPRQLTENTVVLASHNQGKVGEIRDLLTPFAITVLSAAELNLPEPEEVENSYIGNAILKAKAAALASGMPAISDDSGFELMAINKDPGLYSARWAGENKDFTAAMNKVNDAFIASKSDNRHCRFVCALSIVWPDGHAESVEGIIDGTFIWPPRGEYGFGYDPIFQPQDSHHSFGEIDPALKHRISHRAKAFEMLIACCLQGKAK